jgi:hypothetical protein
MISDAFDPREPDQLSATSDVAGGADRRAESGAWDRADAMIDEWGLQSFPASDPPSNW